MLTLQILLLAAVVGAVVSLFGVARALWSPPAIPGPEADSPATGGRKTGPPPPGSIRCHRCGAHQPPAHRFCAACGGPLDGSLCPGCGSETSPADAFCGTCGAELGGNR